jgi:MFS family permease
MLPVSTLIPLILFIALVLASSLYGLAASGHFPRRRKTIGPIVLFGSMGLVIICLVCGIAATVRFTPWYAAVIGGGLSVLAAPLVLQWFPDRFVDGSGALAAFAATGAIVAIVLIALAIA